MKSSSFWFRHKARMTHDQTGIRNFLPEYIRSKPNHKQSETKIYIDLNAGCSYPSHHENMPIKCWPP